MTYRDPSITADSPAVYAIDATIDRMLRVITRQDAENLLPIDGDDDDLIESRIRIRLNICRKMLAHWIGFGVDNGRYEICGQRWISRDGVEWIDSRTSEPVDSDEFHDASITLIGGPRDGEVIR